MKLFGIWTILVALCISVVAAYYSIVGLVAIFAASALPVIIMGSVLEVGKITTAIYLHLFWDKAKFIIKTYLTIALLLLMFITSMGIFGFLSKAHIEQTSVAGETTAVLQRVTSGLDRNADIINRAEIKINKLETADDTANTTLQQQIDSQEASKLVVYQRLRVDIDGINNKTLASVAPYKLQVEQATATLIRLQELSSIDTKDRPAVRLLQAFVKAKPDGAWGSKTADAVQEFKRVTEESRQSALQKIDELNTKSSDNIQSLRSVAAVATNQTDELIGRLRSQLGTKSDSDVEAEVEEQRVKIVQAEIEIEELLTKKYEIEAEARMLEAEVGPVKYIAEMIYGDAAGRNILEEAVRWVILLLVAVFDPLAVVLVIAGISTVEMANARKKPKAKVDEEESKEDSLESQEEIIVDSQDKQVHDEETLQLDVDTIKKPAYKHSTAVISDGLTQKEIDELIREQLELNQTSRNIAAKDKVDTTINKMKADGQWPDSSGNNMAIETLIEADQTGELRDLINKADGETLREVLNKLLNTK